MFITNSISIEYRIQFHAPFHFGTGLRNGLIHRSISRNADNFLYIPGSTLKGVVRERSEQLAQLFGLEVREPHAETLSEANSNLDIITRIFGSRFYPGQLYFDDAQLIDEQLAWFEPNMKGRIANDHRRKEFREWQTEKRTQVSISRLLGTAEQGHLYNSEYGVQTLCFNGCVKGRLAGFSLPESARFSYSLLLLIAAMQSLDGDAIGGNKSTGGGRFHIEISGLQVEGTPVDVTQLLHHLENLEYYQIEREEET